MYPLHFIYTADTHTRSILTFYELMSYKTGNGNANINIAERIGTKYHQFGVALLEVDYNYMEDLERQFMNNATRINCHILQKWLDGRGKQPKTMATLIKVLNDIELGTLACELK